jgi:tartrate/fumarate subfamily iron-sulfur-dependent hydro-lyase alpha chain
MVNVQEKMRNIKVPQIKNTLKSLLIDASFKIPADIIDAVKRYRQLEGNKRAVSILDMILKNSVIAADQHLPLCQDCGTVYIDIGLGPDVCINSGPYPDIGQHKESVGQNCNNLQDPRVQALDSEELYDYRAKERQNEDCLVEKYPAGECLTKESHLEKYYFLKDELNKTVTEVYKNNYLRTSIVADPFFERNNTGNNTPAIINVDFKKSLGLSIDVSLKGGGSENCSWLFMLNPSTEKGAIIDMVLKLVKENASKACPPIIVGIGMGSTASEVLKLARKAVFRNLSLPNPDVSYQSLEKEILESVNKTGVGPQGLGGNTTALACNIEFAPCHMATLPFAVMFGCHSTRRASFTL